MAKKILVVDDEPHIVKMIASRLAASQYEVVTARDGVEALERVRTERPDLIVLDVLMPEMDGYTFLKELKARHEQGSRIPVIVLTAKEKMKDLFDLEHAADYLVKPYRPEELLASIRKQLDE